MSLCGLRNILGEPNSGLHKLRLFNIAIIDVILTLLLARFNQVVFHKLFPYSYGVWLIITFLSGIVLHRIFCVNTTINMAIFGKV